MTSEHFRRIVSLQKELNPHSAFHFSETPEEEKLTFFKERMKDLAQVMRHPDTSGIILEALTRDLEVAQGIKGANRVYGTSKVSKYPRLNTQDI